MRKNSRKVRKGNLKLSSFENELSLSSMSQIKHSGWDTSAYVLTQRTQVKFIFGFDCKGIYINSPQDQVDKILDNLESGLKDLPQGEQITLLGSKKP